MTSGALRQVIGPGLEAFELILIAERHRIDLHIEL
jgi:hypothetical protein